MATNSVWSDTGTTYSYSDYLFSDDDYEFTEVSGNGYCVSFSANGEIKLISIKQSAIDEIKEQPYFR